MKNLTLTKLEKTILLHSLRHLKQYCVDAVEHGNISELERKIEGLVPDVTVVSYDGKSFYSGGEEVTPNF